MAYNQFSPYGLAAINAVHTPWSGATSEFLIKSGYANNIFVGDLVYQGADGFLHNLSELGTGNAPPSYEFSPAIGVFVGCSYTVPTASSPISPANPGASYWPARTTTLDGLYATAKVLMEPNIVYTIQADVTGLAFDAQGKTASVSYTYVDGSGTNPTGDELTGLSKMVLNGASVGGGDDDFQALRNLRILRFVPDTTSTIVLPGAGAVRYAQVEVLIQNHQLVQRAPGV